MILHLMCVVQIKIYDMKKTRRILRAGICGDLRLRIFLKYDIEQIKLCILNLVFVITRRRLMLIKKDAEDNIVIYEEKSPN